MKDLPSPVRVTLLLARLVPHSLLMLSVSLCLTLAAVMTVLTSPWDPDFPPSLQRKQAATSCNVASWSLTLFFTSASLVCLLLKNSFLVSLTTVFANPEVVTHQNALSKVVLKISRHGCRISWPCSVHREHIWPALESDIFAWCVFFLNACCTTKNL